LLPLDIDPLTHPRLTVTGWVFLGEAWESSKTGTLLGVGSRGSGSPQLLLNTKRVLEARAGKGRAVFHEAPIPIGQWTHVAAVWDYRAQTLRLHVGEAERLWTDRVADPAVIAANERTQPLLEHPSDEERPPRRYALMGAGTLQGSYSLGPAGLDDLRIYAGALTPEEIAAIRESESGPADPSNHAIAPPPSDAEDEQLAGEGVDWILSEDYVLSDVSGSWGDQPRQLVDLETVANWSVVITERRDVPCRVWILTDGRDHEAHAGSDDCGGNPYDVPRLADGYAVTGLQVCQNRRNERIKGLRIAGRRIELDAETGEVVFREQDDSAEWLSNCGSNEWVNPVLCDGERVASGVRVHFNRAGSRDAIVGLQLVCRDVVGVHR